MQALGERCADGQYCRNCCQRILNQKYSCYANKECTPEQSRDGFPRYMYRRGPYYSSFARDVKCCAKSSQSKSARVLPCRFFVRSAVYELDIYIAVIAGDIQRFLAAGFAVRQGAAAALYFALNSEVVIAAYNRAGNIPVLYVQRQAVPYAQVHEGDVASVGGNAYASVYGQGGECNILVRRGQGEAVQQAVGYLQRYLAVL